MLSIEFAPIGADAAIGVRRSRLIVTRRGVADSTYRAVGYLDKVIDDGQPFYEFRYLEAATHDAHFLPIVGFGDVHRRYRSSRLFPSFADRVMSAKRPDRSVYLAGLDLESDADAWEILAASGGHREGDPIELISLPTWDIRKRARPQRIFSRMVFATATRRQVHTFLLSSRVHHSCWKRNPATKRTPMLSGSQVPVCILATCPIRFWITCTP